MENEWDKFAFRLKALTKEKNVNVQANMLFSLMDGILNTPADMIPFEESAYFLGHSFMDSFAAMDLGPNGLLMKLNLRRTDTYFASEIVFLLLATGKTKTLQMLYKRAPWIFVETNTKNLFNEVTVGNLRFSYYDRTSVFWNVGKDLK
jgi:hypothetical protein